MRFKKSVKGQLDAFWDIDILERSFVQIRLSMCPDEQDYRKARDIFGVTDNDIETEDGCGSCGHGSTMTIYKDMTPYTEV